MNYKREILREQMAVFIANMVYGLQGSDQANKDKQTGKEYAGEALLEILSGQEEYAIKAFKKKLKQFIQEQQQRSFIDMVDGKDYLDDVDSAFETVLVYLEKV